MRSDFPLVHIIKAKVCLFRSNFAISQIIFAKFDKGFQMRQITMHEREPWSGLSGGPGIKSYFGSL